MKLFRLGFWIVLLAAGAFAPRAAFAVCDNPSGVEGDITYNTTHNMMQFCDDTDWIAMAGTSGGTPCADDDVTACVLDATRSASDPEFTAANIADGVTILGVTGTLAAGGGLSGPSGCEDIGDACADGTVFAGYHPITHDHLFIPTTDQGTTSTWKTSIGVNDIATDSIFDGRANTNQVANSTTFPAFKLCKDLAAGGHSDWYLPSTVELYYISSVRSTIQAEGNITNFQNTPYWSSTESNTDDGVIAIFAEGAYAYGGLNVNNKAVARRVRCVRR